MRINTVSIWSSRVWAVTTEAFRSAATSCKKLQRARLHSSSRRPTVTARPVALFRPGWAARAVIKGGDDKLSPPRPVEAGCGGEQNHRIEAAADRQNAIVAGLERRLDRAIYRSCFNGRSCHDSFNLPIDGGARLGDARSAWNAMGVDRPYLFLHSADLAQYTSRLLPHATADGGSAQLADRLA